MTTTAPVSGVASPLVSVVMPVYNGAKTIRETVQSVLSQTLPDFELLVINDGSTDATASVLASMSDPRLRIHTYENKGLSASRNRGIQLARGKYVAFIDADDLWTADKLKKQAAMLEADPGVGLVYSLTDFIDEHGRYLGQGSHKRDSGDVYERLLVTNFLENGSTPLIRREVFNDAGLFDETLKGAEDWDVYLRIAHIHRFACVPEAQVLYRLHSGTVSSQIRSQEVSCLRVLRSGLDRLPPSPERDHLQRLSVSLLYRYLARRAILTAGGRLAVLPAYRCLWLSLWKGRRGWTDFAWAARALVATAAVTLLPTRIAKRLVSGAHARLGRRRGEV